MTNQLTVTLVVIFLGLVAVVSLGLSGWLIHDGITDSAVLLAITTPGTTALGAIAGVLASTRVAQPAAVLEANAERPQNPA